MFYLYKNHFLENKEKKHTVFLKRKKIQVSNVSIIITTSDVLIFSPYYKCIIVLSETENWSSSRRKKKKIDFVVFWTCDFNK